jgi:hypothetical protein
MTFQTNGYQIVENAIEESVAKSFAEQLQFLIDTKKILLNGQSEMIDGLVPISNWIYSPVFGEFLLLKYKNTIEKVVGKKLFPTYSYARIYWPGSEMPKHTDRPACEYSATITLDYIGENWPIFIKDYSGAEKKVFLNPGSMLIYHGVKLAHWREVCSEKTKKQYQVFIHYVDAENQSSHLIYDQRKYLTVPRTPE